MRITNNALLRLSGLGALAAGAIFVVIQPFHPADDLASVTTTSWTVIQSLKLMMSFLFLAGVTGIYARQAPQVGWLGFAGFLALSASWALQSGFVFAEAFLLPPLAQTAPDFVASTLSIINGSEATVGIGAMPAVYGAAGLLYLLGGLLFGVATYRARVLPRGGAVFLAVGALLPIALSSFVAHPYDRLFALPVGVGLAWLGASLVWGQAAQKWSLTRPGATMNDTV